MTAQLCSRPAMFQEFYKPFLREGVLLRSGQEFRHEKRAWTDVRKKHVYTYTYVYIYVYIYRCVKLSYLDIQLCTCVYMHDI